MKIVGDYDRDGYAHLGGLVSPEIARAFLHELKRDVGDAPIPLSRVEQHPNLLKRAAFEAYGAIYKPLNFFLWGLTPTMSQVVNRELLPTYAYFRIYREGDVCRVHSDRYACEHSLSLTLDYSDGADWSLEVGKGPVEPSSRVDDDWGTEPFSSVSMAVGDAVLYQGVHRRHGRTTPNRNGWSAHAFLHWVDRNGPYAEHAFDGRMPRSAVNFTFC